MEYLSPLISIRGNIVLYPSEILFGGDLAAKLSLSDWHVRAFCAVGCFDEKPDVVEAFRYWTGKEFARDERELYLKRFLILSNQNFLICIEEDRDGARAACGTDGDKDGFALLKG